MVWITPTGFPCGLSPNLWFELHKQIYHAVWWENGDIPPLHRPCLGEQMQDGTLAWPAPSSFPYLRHLLYTRAFSSRTPLSFHHALLFITRTSLYHSFLFSIVFFFGILLKSCLYISDLDRNSNLPLSAATCSQRSSSQLRNRNKRSFCKLQVCEPHYFTTAV